MGTKKERTHERIVECAGRAIRRSGYDGASVADIMKDAGLTHGGFYAHFASRDALLAEALGRAGEASLETLRRAATDRGGEPLSALAEAYLSDAHVKAPESGCTLAALASETRRQAAPLRALASKQVRAFAALLASLIPARRDRDEEALAALCTLVGAVVLARAVDKPDLSRAIRAAARESITRRSRS